MDNRQFELILVLCTVLVLVSLIHSLYTEQTESYQTSFSLAAVFTVKGTGKDTFQQQTLPPQHHINPRTRTNAPSISAPDSTQTVKEAAPAAGVINSSETDLETMTNESGFVYNYSADTNVVKYDIHDIKGTIGALNEEDVALASKLQGLNVAFIGDSLTRYQYISLCHFLEHRSWVADEWRPNPLLEKTHKTWHGFYNVTNKVLAPHEQCDCFRPEKSDRDKWYENRYYYNKQANVSVTYIQAMGVVVDIHGHFAPDDVHSQHGLVAISRNKVSRALWVYSWADVIRKHIGQLVPKPTVLIINAGHWHNKFNLASNRRAVAEAAKSVGVTLIWKTTTFTRKHAITNHNQMNDNAMCRESDLCLNMSWTRDVPSSNYVDRVHFKPHVYNEMNKKLLPFLFDLKKR